uniref:N-acetyltransferase 9-like isoform X1 n=1 Tax=Monopterus albus TaxID=43700 RepID=UPI0009B2F768|nr:N-acetyltransferase 9-like isoform X1 [Monopterus albus]XP_020443091.1 N-acetyltransferase 9-like isoform X1 [Monopterus albus]
MKCPELQHLTASEPPTREQEYDMQWSWREDDDNCTFIIFDKQRWAVPSIEEEQCMVGDVNMFLTDPTDLSLAELEIMTAGDAQCAYLKSDSKSKAEQISTVSLCCGLYISVISCVYLFISGHYIPLVFYRAQLQRQGHWEGGGTRDDALW